MPDSNKTPPIKVLIVDDSIVVRRAVSDALNPDPEIEVIGTAANGEVALDKIQALRPDVVILDIEMPVSSGFDVLRGIKRQRLQVRIVMFSTLTARGARQTIEALSLGAHDYIQKPTAGDSVYGYKDGLKKVAAELCPKIKQFRRRSLLNQSNENGFSEATKKRTVKPMEMARINTRRLKPQIVAIGVSTGGPEALAKLLPRLSPSFPLPIVIVQHMPPLFTKLLAERLDAAAKIKVVEAEEGMPVASGVAYIAPGDKHLAVLGHSAKVFLTLSHAPPENSCRPAADYLFRSVAKVYENRGLGVIMTGMGHDGLKGLRLMREKGASVLAQDEASSVVWGMPSFVVHEGLADAVLPVEGLADAIEKAVL